MIPLTPASTKALRFVFAGSLALFSTLFACSGGASSSSDCTPGVSVSCACPGGSKGAQVCNSDGKSFGTCECGSTSNFPPAEGDASTSHPGSTQNPGTTGNGAACSQASECPSLPCGCSDGSETSYQACNNGYCATVCPSPDVAAGGECLIPSGCFCASQGCAFGTQTCCPNTPTGVSGAACGTDCECMSGDCSQGYCF